MFLKRDGVVQTEADRILAAELRARALQEENEAAEGTEENGAEADEMKEAEGVIAMAEKAAAMLTEEEEPASDETCEVATVSEETGVCENADAVEEDGFVNEGGIVEEDGAVEESIISGEKQAAAKAPEVRLGVTLLDCVLRIPSVMERIMKECYESWAPLFEYLEGSLEKIDEIVFIGSGTSGTAAMTSRPFVEKVSGLRTKLVTPGDYEDPASVLNKNALHVFTSQTGTSKSVISVLERLVENGCYCVSLTESGTTPLALESPCHVCLNCGKEEYLMRTIGYTASVLNHMLLGLMLGLRRGFLTEEAFSDYLTDAAKAPADHRRISADCLKWFRANAERRMVRSSCIVFTGSGSLAGVAQEASVKIWEMPLIASVGLELEEGLHGPAYGYTAEQAVVILSDGGRASAKAQALARYLKAAFGTGILVGPDVVDETDLYTELHCGDFACLALSAVPQIMAYRLAEDGGRDLRKPADHTLMYSYFTTHQ